VSRKKPGRPPTGKVPLTVYVTPETLRVLRARAKEMAREAGNSRLPIGAVVDRLARPILKPRIVGL